MLLHSNIIPLISVPIKPQLIGGHWFAQQVTIARAESKGRSQTHSQAIQQSRHILRCTARYKQLLADMQEYMWCTPQVVGTTIRIEPVKWQSSACDINPSFISNVKCMWLMPMQFDPLFLDHSSQSITDKLAEEAGTHPDCRHECHWCGTINVACLHDPIR